MESSSHLDAVKAGSSTLPRMLEAAVRLGRPLLVEHCGEKLDPVLENVLAKAVFKQGPRDLIRIGDKDVDYDAEFRLYLTTSNPNPHFLPEVAIQVNLINFTVTRSGLEEQLLSDVVEHEKPEIEARKNRLHISMAADKKQLKVKCVR